MRPGEQKNVQLLISSSTNLEPRIHFDAPQHQDVEISITPNTTKIPSGSIAVSQLQLKISKSAKEQFVAIPINLIATYNFSSQREPYSTTTTKLLYVNMLRNLGLADYIASNYNALEPAVQNLIQLLTVIGGIAGAIGILLKWKFFDRFRRKRT